MGGWDGSGGCLRQVVGDDEGDRWWWQWVVGDSGGIC